MSQITQLGSANMLETMLVCRLACRNQYAVLPVLSLVWSVLRCFHRMRKDSVSFSGTNQLLRSRTHGDTAQPHESIEGSGGVQKGAGVIMGLARYASGVHHVGGYLVRSMPFVVMFEQAGTRRRKPIVSPMHHSRAAE